MDWNYWLGRKYAVQDQQAQADTLRANAGMLSAQAGANLDTVRAGLLPAESKANIGLTGAQMAAANAAAAQTNEETKYIGQKALADIFATRQQGAYYGSEAAQTNRQGLGLGFPSGADSPLSATTSISTNPLLQRILRNVYWHPTVGFTDTP